MLENQGIRICLYIEEASRLIKKIEKKDIPECVKVIRESFHTVAEEFGFTVENAPGFTAFATTEERLVKQF